MYYLCIRNQGIVPRYNLIRFYIMNTRFATLNKSMKKAEAYMDKCKKEKTCIKVGRFNMYPAPYSHDFGLEEYLNTRDIYKHFYDEEKLNNN